MGLYRFNLSAFGRLSVSSSGREQSGHPDQIVGCHCKDELERNATYTSVFGFVQSGDRLGPGEAFLDPLADDLADSIARMPCRAAIDGGGAVGGVLRHMRSNVQFPQIGDEVLCVVSFVGAQRQASGSRRAPDDHLDGRFPLRRSGGGCERRTDDEPMPVLHQSMSHVAELGSLAAAFAIKPGIRVRGRGMRLVAALLVVEMPLAVAPWRGWLV